MMKSFGCAESGTVPIYLIFIRLYNFILCDESTVLFSINLSNVFCNAMKNQ